MRGKGGDATVFSLARSRALSFSLSLFPRRPRARPLSRFPRSLSLPPYPLLVPIDMLTRSMLHSMKATKQAPTTQKRRATPPDARRGGAGREEAADASPAPEGGGGREEGGERVRRARKVWARPPSGAAARGAGRPEGEAGAGLLEGGGGGERVSHPADAPRPHLARSRSLFDARRLPHPALSLSLNTYRQDDSARAAPRAGRLAQGEAGEARPARARPAGAPAHSLAGPPSADISRCVLAGTARALLHVHTHTRGVDRVLEGVSTSVRQGVCECASA